MMNTLFRQVINQSALEDVAMCLYPVNPAAEPEKKPLFYYHLAKNGGLAVHTALKSALTIEKRHSQNPVEKYYRFQATDDLSDEFRRDLYGASLGAVSYVGIIGVGTFGMHENFAVRPWRLMTILRDPFDRLVSDYFYQIRRGDRKGPVSESDFLDFVNEWQNVCYQSRMLCRLHGPDRDIDSIRQEALENIDTFDFAGTIDHIEDTLLNVWSMYNFPPVLTQKIHSNPYKTNELEHLRDDVYEINRADVELVDMITKAPRSPHFAAPEKEHHLNLAPLLGVVVDTQQDTEFVGAGDVFETTAFMETLQKEPRSLADFLK